MSTFNLYPDEENNRVGGSLILCFDLLKPTSHWQSNVLTLDSNI